MTFAEFIQSAADVPLRHTEVDAFCQRQRITPAAFCDEFARLVASGYAAGQLPWVSADVAMNHLLGLASAGYQEVLPDFAMSVFLAFDAGEYHPHTPHLTCDEVTSPAIRALLQSHSVT